MSFLHPLEKIEADVKSKKARLLKLAILFVALNLSCLAIYFAGRYMADKVEQRIMRSVDEAFIDARQQRQGMIVRDWEDEQENGKGIKIRVRFVGNQPDAGIVTE